MENSVIVSGANNKEIVTYMFWGNCNMECGGKDYISCGSGGGICCVCVWLGEGGGGKDLQVLGCFNQ